MAVLLRHVSAVASCAVVCATVFTLAPFPLQRSLSLGIAGASPHRSSLTATAHAASATVRVTVQPSRGGVIALLVTVSVKEPHGALAYDVNYGDGSTTSLPAPQVCAQKARPSASRAWLLHHRYHHPGTYHVVATGSAVCTAGRPQATVKVTAG